MKILYLSCHAILEYDELKLFEDLNVDFFSLGSYINPQSPADPIRPALKALPKPDLIHSAPEQNKLTQTFVEPFDAIIVMHKPEWIVENWPQIKHKRVIWRSIGQSTASVERMLAPMRAEGLEVVRYSPREQVIGQNIGADAVIRFYKDPDEFKNWNGGVGEIITFAQNMKHRAEYCNYDIFAKLVQEWPNAHVYGPKNEDSGPLNGGYLTYDEMKNKMRYARVYIYTGTQPASYTLNFIEAMMTGIPMVCIGPKYANSLNIAGDTYEIPDIIANGVNGFVSDDLAELRSYIDTLLHDYEFACKIGDRGRETAVQLFGKETIMQQWKEFLKI